MLHTLESAADNKLIFKLNQINRDIVFTINLTLYIEKYRSDLIKRVTVYRFLYGSEDVIFTTGKPVITTTDIDNVYKISINPNYKVNNTYDYFVEFELTSLNVINTFAYSPEIKLESSSDLEEMVEQLRPPSKNVTEAEDFNYCVIC